MIAAEITKTSREVGATRHVLLSVGGIDASAVISSDYFEPVVLN